MIVWLIVWNWVKFETFLKVKWEGIKGLSQTFIFAFMISMKSNSFHHKTLERRWHDFFHLKSKGFLKRFEFYLEIFQIIKLYATQWFSRAKIKWLLQNIWNISWEFQRIKFKSFWKLFLIWSYLGFIQIIFSKNKKNIQKIG